MRFIQSLFILAFVLASAVAANAQQTRQISRPSEAIEAMIAAVTARDADAVAALYTEGAIVLGPNQPVVSGRAAIRESWARNFASGYSVLAVTDSRTETGTDRAALVMLWTATIAPQGSAPQQVRGRSILYFQRQAEGWIISADMWQPAP